MRFSNEEIRRYYRERLPRINTVSGEWRGPCPVHGGKDDNFTVNPNTGDAYCHSQCQRGWSIVQLEMELSGCDAKDAVARIASIAPAAAAPLRKVAEYDYCDEDGNILYQVLRYEPKTFRQRRRNANGIWSWGLGDVRRVLYRLPEVVAAGGRTIHVVEGEKDVHAIEAIGLTATCNPGGAGKWKPEYSEALRGRFVCIIPDNDEPGLRHGVEVARSLLGVAGAIWWIPLPREYKDVSEFLNSNGLDAWDAWMEIAIDIRTEEQVADLAPKPKVVCITDSRGPEPVPERMLPGLPEDVWTGFAAEYRDLMREATEAPASFHMASLLTATGCLMGRDVFMRSPRVMYGNLFTLLVGDTAMARKTTSIQFACDLAMNAATKLGVNIKPMYGIASVEGLAANMMEKDGSPSRVLAIEDEFRSLLKKGQQKSVSNLIPRLTEAYNHLPTFEVNTRTDRLTVKGFFLSMAAASTPEWFADSMSALDISGGFLNRWCIFTGAADRPLPRPDPVSQTRWDELVADLALRVAQARGHRAMSDAAGAKYDGFYVAHWQRAKSRQTAQATARIAMHAQKFAMIFSVMEGHGDVEADDMERGIAIAEYCAESAAVLASDVGATKGGMLEKRVVRALAAGPMSAGELLRKLGVSADDLNRTTKALEGAGMIRISRETTAGRNRIVLSLAAA